MANHSFLSNATQASSGAVDDTVNHTVTFVIGFSVLMLFLILGVAASAFLCITLKKDPYLWIAEAERHLQENQQHSTDEKLKFEEGLETTQM